MAAKRHEWPEKVKERADWSFVEVGAVNDCCTHVQSLVGYVNCVKIACLLAAAICVNMLLCTDHIASQVFHHELVIILILHRGIR